MEAGEQVRAYRLMEWQRPPRLVDTSEPVPGKGEVLVRVAANGLCHSDLAMAALPAEVGRQFGWDMPFTLGHEVGGWVEQLGEGVDGIAPGDPVALVSPRSCGECNYCLRGLESACVSGGAGRGYGRDGGLAELVVAPAAREVILLTGLDPLAAGPLTDAGATSYHAVARARPRLGAGSTAVVIGAGGLGAFAVQILRAVTAARVIAVDLSEARLELARELGAHEVLRGVTNETSAALLERTEGRGAQAVFDLVGVDSTIEAGLAATERTGAFVLVGAGTGTLRRPWFGSLPRDGEVYTFQGSTLSDVREVVSLAERGLVRSDVEVFPLDEVEEAYRRLEAGALRGRAVVTPGA